MIGAAGATASLVSYPALLLVGLPAVSANIANSVAGVAIGLGAVPASRTELKGAAGRLWSWCALVAAGSALGAGLLLITPEELFAWAVPFLVLAGALAVLTAPALNRRRAMAAPARHRGVFWGGLLAVAVYVGYFGAGAGVMLLALFVLSAEPDLLRANAYKNALLLAGEVVMTVGFVAAGAVPWAAVLPLAAGFLIGGAIGPGVARRLPADRLRVLIGCGGIALALWLLLVAVRG